MVKRKIQKTTGFGLGVAAAVVMLLGGALMVADFGAALYAQNAAFALFAAMLLFLAVVERRAENRGRRTRLFLLFVLLVLASLRLPLLDIVEIFVLPGMALMYREKGDGGPLAVLAGCEVLYAAARLLALTSLFGTAPLRVLGGFVLLAGLARLWVLVRLFRRAKQAPPLVDENAVKRL